MKVTLVRATENPIDLIATAASICYGKDEAKNPKKLVEKVYKNGHLSCMEHVYFTFKIEGISRACSHQLVRHRHCSFTQRSQRYCSEDGNRYVTPPSLEFKEDSMDSVVYFNSVNESFYDYKKLCKTAKPEDARYVLTNATCTDLFVSMNLRELTHLSNERLCSKAQWEIRRLVKEMIDLVNQTTNNEFQYMLVPKCEIKHPYNFCTEDKSCGRHKCLSELIGGAD